MALFKEIDSPMGYKLTYHRVANVLCNYNDKTVTIVVEHYTDADFRAKKTVATEYYTDPIDLDVFGDTSISAVYTALKEGKGKTKYNLEGATDC